MFCFPNVGHVIILQRTFSFKFRLIHVQYECIIYDKTKEQIPLKPRANGRNIVE